MFILIKDKISEVLKTINSISLIKKIIILSITVGSLWYAISGSLYLIKLYRSHEKENEVLENRKLAKEKLAEEEKINSEKQTERNMRAYITSLRLNKMVSFSINTEPTTANYYNDIGESETGSTKLITLVVKNKYNKPLQDVQLFINLYNMAGQFLYKVKIDVEVTIPPGKSFTGSFYPCLLGSSYNSQSCINAISYPIGSFSSYFISVTPAGEKTIVVNNKYFNKWDGHFVLLTVNSFNNPASAS